VRVARLVAKRGATIQSLGWDAADSRCTDDPPFFHQAVIIYRAVGIPLAKMLIAARQLVSAYKIQGIRRFVCAI
jgi:hypothetical protein